METPRPGLGKLSFVSLSDFPVFLNKGKPDLSHPQNFTEKPPSGMNSASLTNMCSLFKIHLKIVLKQVRKKYFDISLMFYVASTVWNNLSVNFHGDKSRCTFVYMYNVFYSRIPIQKHNAAIAFVERHITLNTVSLHINSNTIIQSEIFNHGLLAYDNTDFS